MAQTNELEFRDLFERQMIESVQMLEVLFWGALGLMAISFVVIVWMAVGLFRDWRGSREGGL